MELYPTPDNPPPPGATAHAVTTADGVSLRAMTATYPGAKGTVVLLGGRGDFIERYFETMRDFMARGYAVAALDVRGQGGSQRPLSNPLRNHVQDFAQFDEDLRAFMSQVVLPHCPAPYLALGHSTGGNVLLRSLVRHDWFTRAAAISPLVGILYGAWPLFLVRLLVFIATRLGLGWMFLPGQARGPLGRKDFPGNPLHGDAGRWNRDSAILEAHPQLGSGGPTFSWLRAARKATAELRAMNARTRLNCPVLIVAGGLDRVVDNEAIRAFARRVPGVSLVFVREGQHELLSGPDDVRGQFLAAFEAFVSEAA